MAVLGAQTNRASMVVLDDETTARVKKACELLGVRGAMRALGITREVLYAARDHGRMRTDTAERVKAAIVKLEGLG